VFEIQIPRTALRTGVAAAALFCFFLKAKKLSDCKNFQILLNLIQSADNIFIISETIRNTMLISVDDIVPILSILLLIFFIIFL
jgi:hypothetical protein